MDLYHRPANVFVASFIGSPKMNFIDVTEEARDGDTVRLRRTGNLALELALDLADSRKITRVGIRPEHLQLTPDGQIEGRVVASEHLGSETLVYVETPEGTLISKIVGDVRVAPGEVVRLAPQPEAVHSFDAEGVAIARRGRTVAA